MDSHQDTEQAQTVQEVRLKDVAKRAGVSTATTSRVLTGSGFVSAPLRERVLAAARELNYTPNGIARMMASQRTLSIGLVVSDITNPFFTVLARGVEDRGQASGYNVILCNTDEDANKEKTYLSVLSERRVDGILLAPANHESDYLQRMVDSGTRLVLIDRHVPDLNVPTVQADNVAAMVHATEYLIGLGHRRIGVVAGRSSLSTSTERVEGYKTALRAAHISVDASLIVDGNYTAQGGYDSGLLLMSLESRPTAIISCNNLMTTGLLVALRDHDIAVPRDVSLIGFDELPFFRLLEHPLTTIAQPVYEMGRRSCDLLLQAVKSRDTTVIEPVHVRLPTRLIIRQSCRGIEVM